MQNNPESELPFDAHSLRSAREFATGLLLLVPELRSIAITFDWTGALNDAKVMHGLWQGVTGPNRQIGPVQSLEGVFGSCLQTLRMFNRQLEEATRMLAAMREKVQVLGTEAVRKHEELQELEKKIVELRGELGRSPDSDVQGRQEKEALPET